MATLTVRLAQLELTVVQGAAVAIWKRQNTTTGAAIPGGASYVFTDVNGIATIALAESGAGEVYEIRIIIRGDVKLSATFAMPGTDANLDELTLNVDDDTPAPGVPVTAGVSTLSNQGGGAELFKGLVSTVAQLRTLIAGDGVSITTVGDTIVITSTAPAGATGPAGTNGTNGTNGLSAYQIAVANGFAGTESQWLDSLRGVQGIQGETGNTGATGQSAYALAVALGFVGTEGDWIASLKGVKGDIGDDGPPGDTGPAGPAGPTGPAGAQGIQGKSAYEVAVDNGYTGSQSEWLANLVGESGLTAWDMTDETVSCLYPLDRSSIDIVSDGFDGIPTQGDAFTLNSYLIQSALGTQKVYVSRGALLAAVDVSAETRVLEWGLTSEALTGGAGVTALKIRFGLIDKTTPANVVGVLEFDLKDDGVKTVTLITDLGSSSAVTLASMPARVSMAFNAVAGTIAVRLDDVAQVFSANTYTATADATLEMRFTESSSVIAGLAGKAFSVQQYTAAHQIIGTHAAGSQDICGHVINEAGLPTGPNSVLIVSEAGTYKGVSYAVGDILVVHSDGITLTKTGNALGVYTEGVTNGGSQSTTLVVDMSAAALTYATLTGNAAISFTGAVAGRVYSHTLELLQDGTGGWVPTWTNVKWEGGAPPPADTAAGKLNVYSFYTRDGGTTIIGGLAVKGAA